MSGPDEALRECLKYIHESLPRLDFCYSHDYNPRARLSTPVSCSCIPLLLLLLTFSLLPMASIFMPFRQTYRSLVCTHRISLHPLALSLTNILIFNLDVHLALFVRVSFGTGDLCIGEPGLIATASTRTTRYFLLLCHWTYWPPHGHHHPTPS